MVNGGYTLVGQSAPVVAARKIFVYAKVIGGTGNRVLAFSEVDGSLLWVAVVGDATLDSRSAPTVDLAHGQVLIGSGTRVTAITVAPATAKVLVKASG